MRMKFALLMAVVALALSSLVAPAAMAGEPEDDLPMSQPFRVVSWHYLRQSEGWGLDWGADVVLSVDYDGGYSAPDDYFIVDWPCFWALLIGKQALNQFVSVPYGSAGEHYPDGWKRLLRIEQTVTP